jgi:CRISPR-associated endonuclease Csn1
MSEKNKKVLSLDPGITSIGWALTEQNTKGELTKFIDGGSRIFQSVKEAKGNTFKNEKRRNKRLARRNKCRSNRRMSKLENYLMRNNLLSIKVSELEDNTGLVQQIIGNPYELRKKAIDEPLTANQLGWAIMHLAKRRGFLSSSKSLTNDEKKEQARADELALNMKEDKCRTLGEYFSNRHEKGERVRGEKLKRQLVQDELALMLDKQKENNSILTEVFIKEINEIIFNQRPLKVQKRISVCKFESFGEIKKYTAAKYHPLSQQFIIWGFINNLKYNDNTTGGMKELLLGQKNTIFKLLWENKEITYKRVIKDLKLNIDTTFNFQKDEKDKIQGNQLLTYLKAPVKKWFNDLSEEDKINLVQDLSTINDLTGFALKKRLYNRWTKDEVIMDNLMLTSDKLPQGYTSLCMKATRKVLPFLQQGHMYYHAEKLAYPKFAISNTKIAKLPPVEGITNGVVLKSCTQVRHLINTLIDTYGEIDIIKIELARDLSKSSKQISEINSKNRKNKELNDEARDYLVKNDIDTNHDNITKYKLWKESINKDGVCESCYPEKDSSRNWFFPSINLSNLYGANATYEIEHIIPKSISGDDSYSNKSLCKGKTNAQKGNQTPYDFYFQKGGQTLIDMIAKNAYSKLGKFKGSKFVISTTNYLNDNPIQKRFLNDTRYLSVFLKEYLQPVCKEEIVVSKGGFTAIIRRSLNLNKLLGNEFNKNRGDHRHHMVDAFCTSLISPRVLNIIDNMRKEVNRKTQQYIFNENKLKSFVVNVEKDFKEHFEKVITSHEVESKLKGELEEETLYGHEKITLEDGSILEKFFNHKSYEDITGGKSAEQLLEEHDKYKIELPKGLKKYLENNNKLPDIFSGWKRIKSYYNELAVRDSNEDIKGFRTVRDKKGNVQGYKKTDSKAYTIIYNDYTSEAVTKMEEAVNKPTFNNILFKLYRGDLLQSPEGDIYKIYQLPKGKVAIHPVNEVRIQDRDLKNYPNGKINARKSSINVVFNKEKMDKTKVNIVGHII